MELLLISPFLNSLQCREASKHKVACWPSTLRRILRQQGESRLGGFETTLCKACQMATRTIGATSIWETSVCFFCSMHAYIHYDTYVHGTSDGRVIPMATTNSLHTYFLLTKNRTSHRIAPPMHLLIHTRKLDLRFEPYTNQPTNKCMHTQMPCLV